MLKDAEPPADAAARTFTAAFALLAAALACSIVVLVTPRPVYPSQLPALRLAPPAVDAQLARDRALAARAVSGADVERLLALYRDEGRSELESKPDLQQLNDRRFALRSLAKAVFERLGPERTQALIATTVAATLKALLAGEQGEHALGLLGDSPRLLAQYGYIDGERRLLAPELSLRGFYKARFNLLCERPLTADLSPIELQAYQGWNALHAGGLAPERRALAARAFYEAGGQHGAEALAIWLFQGGSRVEAMSLLKREYQRTGALRLRNMALYALHEPP